ncbi:MAG TPA: phosphatase PAP2 family protein [Sporichthyaceae bacterium]|jgi:undecaprenyl-diphosphatase|nr:phosphatase PAP2 family protein [Sporichthyaceae bacterium]
MNYDLFRTINDWSRGHTILDDLMKFAAKDLLFLVFAAFALLCGARLQVKDYRPVGLAFGTVIVTFAAAQIAAKLHTEARPFVTHPSAHELISHSADQSFPSDHATAAFGIAVAVLLFLSRVWGGALFVVGLLIGFARVFVGVHYPGDIAGGLAVAVIGGGVMAAVAYFLPREPVAVAKPVAGRR